MATLLRFRKPFVGLLFAFILGSCSTTSFFAVDRDCVIPLTQDELASATASGSGSNIWIREENSLSFRIVAAPGLNRLQRFSHGIAVGFYQMENPDAFVREIATQSGIRRLVLLENIDDTILQHDIKTIQPNSSDRLDAARVENARYIGVIAGYSSLITDRTVRLIRIPMVRTTRSSFNPVNWLSDAPAPRPARLDILIMLGDQQIDDVVINVRGECGIAG